MGGMGMGWGGRHVIVIPSRLFSLTAAIFETEVGERGWPIVAGDTSLGDRMRP